MKVLFIPNLIVEIVRGLERRFEGKIMRDMKGWP